MYSVACHKNLEQLWGFVKVVVEEELTKHSSQIQVNTCIIVIHVYSAAKLKMLFSPPNFPYFWFHYLATGVTTVAATELENVFIVVDFSSKI